MTLIWRIDCCFIRAGDKLVKESEGERDRKRER